MASGLLVEELFQLGEQLGPALLVAIARGLVEELLMVQRQQCAGTVRLQRNGEKRFAFGRRMPGPAEHQPFVRHDLAIDAADLDFFTVGGLETDAVASADAQIRLRLHRALLDLRRAEPRDYFFR